MAFWNWSHNVLGLHVYAIPTIILALAVLVVILVHHHNQKKRDQEFEDKLEGKNNTANTAPASAGAEGGQG